MFTGQALKSGQGDSDWLRFFALMSAEFCETEGTPPPPNTPQSRDDRIDEIRALNERLQVEVKLSAYDVVMKESGNASNRYHVMALLADGESPTLTVSSFERLPEASAEYARQEEATSGIDGADVVLVRADSMVGLRRAYPNYFADTEDFRRRLAQLNLG